jgi:hypothetical protein
MDKHRYSDNTYLLDIRIENKGDRYDVTVSAKDLEEETFFPTTDEIQRILGRSRLLDSFLSHPQPGRFSGDIINVGSEIFQRFVQPYPHFTDAVRAAQSHNAPLLITIRASDHDINLTPLGAFVLRRIRVFSPGPLVSVVTHPSWRG